MSYKPDNGTWMAYLYGEMESQEREKLEQYLLDNPEAREELNALKNLRKMLGTINDKEVIAPPIVIGENSKQVFWNVPYLKTIVSVAASLLLIMIIGQLTKTQITLINDELRISFGAAKNEGLGITSSSALVTPEQVQQMINTSLNSNNNVIRHDLHESEQKLNASIEQKLMINAGKIDQFMHNSSIASQAQIQQYMAGLQTENLKLMKDYFQLTSTDQKKYMEDLLIDFAKYMQQQHTNDLKIVQTRLNNLEKNTDLFKQETEQILSGIANQGNTRLKGIKN